MKYLKTLIFWVSLPAFCSLAGANEEEAASALAIAIQKNMAANYVCQEYLGGLGHYRAAKLSATAIFSQITGDRNQAVLSIDQLEKQLMATAGPEGMKKRFDKHKLSYIDRIGTCQDIIAKNHDEVQVLLAELGLL